MCYRSVVESNRKSIAVALGLVAVVGTGLWWSQRHETTYSIHGVYAAGDGDVMVTYFRDDGAEQRTTHIARRAPLDEETMWELDLADGMIVSPRSVMLRNGTLVVADRPAPVHWRVRGIDPETGSIRWSQDVRGEEDHWPDLFGTEDHVFVIGGLPRLRIFSVDSGEVEFEHEFETIGPPHFNDRWLLVSTGGSGVSFVDLATMSLTPKLPEIDGGAVCLIDDAVYGLSEIGARSAAVVRQDLKTGAVMRFEASDDDADWPAAGTSCGWMETDGGTRLVVRNLKNHLVAIDFDPDDPGSGARTAFEMTFDGGELALDHGHAPKDESRPLRGELTRFAPVELVRRTHGDSVSTHGVVDLEQGALTHEGPPFPDSTVASVEWVRDPHDVNRILVNATWFAPGGERHGHVGVLDGSTGALVLDLEQTNLETQPAAVRPDRLWLWIRGGFAPTLPIYAYDEGAQRVVGGPTAGRGPQVSRGLADVLGLSSEP